MGKLQDDLLLKRAAEQAMQPTVQQAQQQQQQQFAIQIRDIIELAKCGAISSKACHDIMVKTFGIGQLPGFPYEFEGMKNYDEAERQNKIMLEGYQRLLEFNPTEMSLSGYATGIQAIIRHILESLRA